MPAGQEEAPGSAAPPDDATHYLCYKAKAAATPSSADGQNPETPPGSGMGRFLEDLEVHFADDFDDCALMRDGVTVPFEGTPVEANCLVHLAKPRELCTPADMSAVEAPRETAATIEESVATLRETALVCYTAKLTRRLRSADAAALGGYDVGDRVRQAKHAKRRFEDGTELSTAPGSGFSRPVAMETKKLDLFCVPSSVIAVANL